MALKVVTLQKNWQHVSGQVFKAGEQFKVTPELYQELKDGGYLTAPKAQKAAPKATKKKITNK